MTHNLYITDFFELFDAVQKAKIFDDQKKMADALPVFSPNEIEEKYLAQKDNENFDLKSFVYDNFKFESNEISTEDTISLPIDEHIERLWDLLERSAEENRGTLIPLPKPYIVPGGRFNEFFYWDSYFVMLGLQESKRFEMMENIVENCSFLIQNFGFVPNANRTYFLSRSQPPYFSLMLDLLYSNTNDEKIYNKYQKTLELEYQFWMNGWTDLQNGSAVKRVLKTKNGDILNRYFDDENEPRPESYMIDIEDDGFSDSPDFYRNIRAACESGWDFSSRWFADNESIKTIETLNICQVDLNCLLWHLEKTLVKCYQNQGFTDLKNDFEQKAEDRKNAIQNYFWDEESGLFRDFNFVENKQNVSENVATLYPLFLGVATDRQAQKVAISVEEKLLFAGGLVTTTKNSGQQWDFPNAWAPFQWLGFQGFRNYGISDLAEKIKHNWCSKIEKVYTETGKLMEKYNAVDENIIGGGGEYPNQDGFGWTNGVYQKLRNN